MIFSCYKKSKFVVVKTSYCDDGPMNDYLFWEETTNGNFWSTTHRISESSTMTKEGAEIALRCFPGCDYKIVEI